MFGPPLHTIHCRGQRDDIERMQIQLQVDPLTLESLQLETVVVTNQTYPLHEASRLAHVKCIDFLLKAGARPDIFDCDIKTAINHAMSDFSTVKKTEETIVETVAVLLKHGASPDYLHPLKPRTSYLDTAIDRRHFKLMQLLLEHGASTGEFVKNQAGELVPNERKFPLWNALEKRSLSAFSMLLLHGTPIEYTMGNRMYQQIIVAFQFSKPQRTIEALKLFYEHGGSFWAPATEGQTALGMLKMMNNCYRGNDSSSEDDSDEEEYTGEKGLFFKGGGSKIIKEVKKMMSTPRSLQSLCRIAMKKTMARDYWKNVKDLPLPLPIISYLQYCDCELVEPDEDSSDESIASSDLSYDGSDFEDIFDVMRALAPDSDADSDGKDIYYYMKLNREYNPDSSDDEDW